METVKNGVFLTEEEYAKLKAKKERKPLKTTTVVLLVLAVFLLIFITTMIVTFWRFQSVPDTLIQMTMGAGGVEAVVLAFIKISKVFKGEE